MNQLLIICGPTATGKTKLALSLAKKFDGELVSADSRQVYQGLDALTGKDRSEDVPIWLYDVIAAGEEFSVAHFVRLAREAVDDIDRRGKLPIVVGGTGFYLRALTGMVDTISIPPTRALRKKLALLSTDTLQAELQRFDARRWGRMNASDRKNPRRLIRAIEVALAFPSSRRGREGEVQNHVFYNTLWIGLTATLPNLKHRIETRIKSRFRQAASEVKNYLPSILGVDPLMAWSRGEMTKDETLRAWANAEYQYAKRQMTWFRKEKDIHWFDVENPSSLRQVEAIVKEWYTRVKGMHE